MSGLAQGTQLVGSAAGASTAPGASVQGNNALNVKSTATLEQFITELEAFANDKKVTPDQPLVVFVDDPRVSHAVHQAALRLKLMPAPYGPEAFSGNSAIQTTTMAAFADLPVPYKTLSWKVHEEPSAEQASAKRGVWRALNSVLSYVNPLPLFRPSQPAHDDPVPAQRLGLEKDKELGLNPAHLAAFPNSISIWKGRSKEIEEIQKKLSEYSNKVSQGGAGEALRFDPADPPLRYATRVIARSKGLVGVAEGSGRQRYVVVWNPNDRAAMEKRLKAFANDPNAVRLALPPMDPELRLEIALLASEYGLIARSRGFGAERQLIIYPKPKPVTAPAASAQVTDKADAKSGAATGVAKAPLMSPSDSQKLKALFDSLTRSPSDGSIRVAELVDAAMNVGLPEIFARDLMKDLSKLAHSKEGDSRVIITFEEFERAVQSKESSIRAAFATLDRNNTGRIRLKEFGAALEMGHLQLSKEDEEMLKALVERARKEGDEGLTYTQFRDFIALLSPAVIRHSGEEYLEAVTKGYTHFSLKPSKKTGEKQTSMAFGVASGTAGGLANAISRTVVAPLERVRLQMSVDPNKYPNILAAIRGIAKAEGIQGLWRGNVLNVIRIAPQGAISFLCKDICRDALPSDIRNTKVGLALSSMASGAICMTAVYPLDMIRGQITTSPGIYPSWWAGLKQIYAKDGMRGLFKGASHSVSWATVYYGVQFFSYDSLKKLYINYWKDRGEVRTIDTVTGLSLGAVSGAFCVAAAYPLELIRRKLQVQGLGGRPIKYANWWDCAKQVMQKEGGIRGYFKGLPANLVKTPPSIAITFGCYEWLLPRLHAVTKTVFPEDAPVAKK